MLPMAMHQKQDRVRRKRRTSAALRSSRLSLEQTFPEEGLKAGPYWFGSSTLYENVPDLGSGTELKKASCSAIMISNPRTSRVSSSPSRNLSVAVDHVPTSIIHAKKSMNMRPLSVPPSEVKRTSRTQSRYLALGIATIVVCGIAFTIWLTYDSLEKFFSSMLN